jgi:hypothetical protein
MSITPNTPEQYGDQPPPGPPTGRSGAVTAVAIVNFVLGGLEVLFGLVIMIMGPAVASFITGVASDASKQSGMNPAEAEKFRQAASAGGGFLTAVVGFIGVCFMIFGVPMILAGIGVLNRRQWGRILTLVLAVLSGLLALLNLISLNIVGLIINGGYAILAFVVLLNAKNAAEFR